MDTTFRLRPLKFSLRTTINHPGPSIHSGHYTASINCCKKHSIATITQLGSLQLLTAKTPPLHMLYYLCSRPETIYIYIYMLFYTSCVFFGLPIVSCSQMIIV